jgi:putative transposase
MEIPMADENEKGATSEVVTTDTPKEVPAPKKQRAPRRLKTAAEATASEPSATSVKSAKGLRKKRVTQVEATPAVVKIPAPAKGRIKGPRKAKSVAQAEVPKMAPVTAGDEMADLIQLEEENKRLRAALAEKLRAENADLRKRLGV